MTRRRRLTPADWERLSDAPELCSIREAAELIGEHPKLVRQWVQLGHIPYAVEAGGIVVPMALVYARERDARHYRQRAGGKRRRTEAR